MKKTKSILNIEERMSELEPGSLRHKVLSSAKNFKSSWIELGQCLFGVYKDKLFKDWGYLTFEAYCAKEIGVRQNTAMRLLKSYSFLEREAPTFLKRESLNHATPRKIPSLESVNALRLARQSDRISEEEYGELREEVLEEGREDSDVKKKIRYILNSHPKRWEAGDLDQKKESVLRKTISAFRSMKAELAEFEFPAKLIKEIDSLIDHLEDLQK